jgi:glycine cleavage system aminomethyltransferase T
MAYVSPEFAQIGTTVSSDIRGNRLAMKVVKLPFYKREN